MSDQKIKLPPQNIGAEQAVLGALLLEPELVPQAAELVTPNEFFRPAHMAIYRVLIDMTAQGADINLVTLFEELKARGSLDTCGGMTYVSGLTGSVANAAGLKGHCGIVREKATRRRLLKGVSGLVEDAYAADITTPELIERASSAVFDITRPARKTPDLSVMVDAAWDRQFLIESGSLTFIPASRIISHVIPGYYPGDDWIITAPSTIGKSSFLTQLVVDACRQGARVLLFTLEDSAAEKLNRVRANVADVSYRLIRQGWLDDYKKGLLQEADKEILGHDGGRRWPLWIYDDVRTLEDLVLTARKHAMQGGVDIIAVDYVQLLRISGKIYERMSLAADTLYNLAKDLGVTMIKLSQVSNAHAKDPGDDLAGKGAGELTAQPDVNIELARKHMDERKWRLLTVKVKKNRQFGDKGDIPLAMSARWTRVVPQAEINEGEY